jgi:AraC family transcriptional regulator
VKRFVDRSQLSNHSWFSIRNETQRMIYPNRIPLLQANGEPVPLDPLFRVVESSVGTSWKDVVIEQLQIPSNEWANVMFKQHVIAVNIGRAMNCEFEKSGKFEKVLKPTGAISFFPRFQPFSLRVQMSGSRVADLIFLALDPQLVTETAEKLELSSDRLELVEQRRPYDPALLHLALALREGIRTYAAADPLYRGALSSALTLHLLREYTTAKPKLKQAGHRLTRQMLLRAVEYIQDQLGKELTVSSVA